MVKRLHRLHTTAVMRRLVREIQPRPVQLVPPIFVGETFTEIGAILGVWRHTVGQIGGVARSVVEAGLGRITLLGVSDDTDKDSWGTRVWMSGGIEQRVITTCREAAGDDLVIMSDMCLDEFTGHGHCGFLAEDSRVIDDKTCNTYAQQVVAQARTGTYVVAPSGMVDSQIQMIRAGLDTTGLEDVGILAYPTKYASTFYGLLRGVAGSSLQGDCRTYQRGPMNRREGLRETLLGLTEDADMVMVRPTSHHLNMLAGIAAISKVPVMACQVSGEYIMIEVAAERGWIDRCIAIKESITSIVRSGVEMVFTYQALEVTERLD